MYLTTKNAGTVVPTHCHGLGFLYKLDILNCCRQPSPYWPGARIWSSRAADIRRGRQGPALQKEDVGSDWCAGSWPPQSEKQTDGVRPPTLRHHRPLWVQPRFLYHCGCRCLSMPTFCTSLFIYFPLFHHLRLCVYLCLSVQSPPENQKLTRETARCTPSWAAVRWSATSRTAVSWSMASMMATCTALRSTLSTRWWKRGKSASWTSTRRYIRSPSSAPPSLFSPFASCSYSLKTCVLRSSLCVWLEIKNSRLEPLCFVCCKGFSGRAHH